MQQVTHNIYVETWFGGCNSGCLVTSQGLVVIDSPQLPSQAAQWQRQLATLGKIRYLINTGPQADHVTGGFFFPAPLIAHQATCESMSLTLVSDLKEQIGQIDPGELVLMADYRLRLPEITFSQRLCLYLGDHTLELIHLPGHTPGQIGVYLPLERAIFTGDNVFCKVQAVFSEAEPFLWLESLKKIEALDVDHVIAGHGEVRDKSCLREQASFIEEWLEVVKDAIHRGWSQEEACDRISFLHRYPMPPGTEQLGPQIQRTNVARLYQVLTRPPVSRRHAG